MYLPKLAGKVMLAIYPYISQHFELRSTIRLKTLHKKIVWSGLFPCLKARGEFSLSLSLSESMYKLVLSGQIDIPLTQLVFHVIIRQEQFSALFALCVFFRQKAISPHKKIPLRENLALNLTQRWQVALNWVSSPGVRKQTTRRLIDSHSSISGINFSPHGVEAK